MKTSMRNLVWVSLAFVLVALPAQAEDEFGKNAGLFERILVGAHYYLWYPENFAYGAYTRVRLDPPQAPVLGEYSSADVAVVEQHIRWAAQHGVDFFTLDFWPKEPRFHSRIDEAFLKAKNIGDIRFCIFYETQNLRFVQPWGATVFTEEVVKEFVDDIRMFSEKYFSHPSYLRINGRPVLVLYLTRTFAKYYERAIAEARAVAKEAGFDIYFIADEIFWDVTEERKHKGSFRIKRREPQLNRIKIFDALTSYNLFTSRYKRHRGFEGARQYIKDNRGLFEKYQAAVPPGMPVFPVVLPGYNDRAVPGRKNPVIPRVLSPTAPAGSFFNLSIQELALPILPESVPLFFVTSWNEWKEDTAIEPVRKSPRSVKDLSESGDYFTQGFPFEGYDTTYLEVLRNNVIAVSGQLENVNDAGVTVTAWHGDTPVAKTVTQSGGYFTLSRRRMAPGKYQVGVRKETAVAVMVKDSATVVLKAAKP